MRNTTRQTRENRTITVDFHNEATYYQLLGDGKAFVECVLAFLLSIGLQLTHKTTCNGGGCLTLHSHYMRVRLGGLTIWRLQCTRCKAVFTVLPHFVLRYHSIPPNVARNALLATHGGLSLELCAVIYQTLSGLTRAEQARYIECGERVTATHAEIVQAARNLHDEIRDTLCGETQHIFDHATPFHPGHDVFDDHACAGDERIEAPVLHAQHLALRFFFRRSGQHPRRLRALQARVLAQRRVGGIVNLRRIGGLLGMRCAGHRRPQRDDFGGVFVHQQDVLVRMGFRLAAVLLLLLRGIGWTLATALRAVDDAIGSSLKGKGAGGDPARVALWRDAESGEGPLQDGE